MLGPNADEHTTTPMAEPSSMTIGEPDIPAMIPSLASKISSGPSGFHCFTLQGHQRPAVKRVQPGRTFQLGPGDGVRREGIEQAIVSQGGIKILLVIRRSNNRDIGDAIKEEAVGPDGWVLIERAEERRICMVPEGSGDRLLRQTVSRGDNEALFNAPTFVENDETAAVAHGQDS
jgi:hypothetical protein